MYCVIVFNHLIYGNIYLRDTVVLCRKDLVNFDVRKTQAVLFDGPVWCYWCRNGSVSNCLIGKEVDEGRGWREGSSCLYYETAYENIRVFLGLYFISMFVPFTFALAVVRVGWCSWLLIGYVGKVAVCWTVRPTFPASFEVLTHSLNVSMHIYSVHNH